MGARSLKLLLRGYVLAFVLALVLRTVLLFRYTNVHTGLLTYQSPLLPALRVFLALVVTGLFFAAYLRRTEHDYPQESPRGARWRAALAVLAGVGILAQTFLDAPFPMPAYTNETVVARVGGVLVAVLGALAGTAFCWLGLSGWVRRVPAPHALLLLAMPVWQAAVLVARYNGYTTLLPVSDNLLAVLYMVFSALFLLGHARTLCGLARRDSRNYALPAGLSAALFGLLLVVPNYLYALLRGGGQFAAPLLLPMESLAVLCNSVYALLFCLHMLRSIRYV